MPLFLFRPHVEGPKGEVTTPDVVIDRIYLDRSWKPVSCLTSECAHQLEASDRARTAYALTALGGGTIISPAFLVGPGRIVLPRMAWRLDNFQAHVEKVTLCGTPLSELIAPAKLISQAGGSGLVLHRGTAAVCPASEGTVAEILDPELGRRLSARITVEAADLDRWDGQRPFPRYSTGPTQKDVPHFI